MHFIMKEKIMKFDYKEFTSGFKAAAEACVQNSIEQAEYAKKFAKINRDGGALSYETNADTALCKSCFFNKFNRQDIRTKAQMLDHLNYLAILTLKPSSAFDAEFFQKQWILIVKENIAKVEKMDD